MRTSLKTAAAGTVATMVLGGAVLAGTTGAQASSGRQLAGTWAVTVDPDGDADAIEVGERVRLGGGYPSEHYEDVTCGGQDRAPAFEVDQVVTAP